MVLNLALSYSGRAELVDVVARLAEGVARGEIAPEGIDESMIGSLLYRPELPEPDLVIRTSGEQRISNFMIWQIAYAELCFADAPWPDSRRPHLYAAIREFQRRDRRFGLVREAMSEKAG